MAFTAQTVRNAIPVPPMKPHPIIGWALLIVAVVVLYDSYDGSGKAGPWPLSTIFPW